MPQQLIVHKVQVEGVVTALLQLALRLRVGPEQELQMRVRCALLPFLDFDNFNFAARCVGDVGWEEEGTMAADAFCLFNFVKRLNSRSSVRTTSGTRCCPRPKRCASPSLTTLGRYTAMNDRSCKIIVHCRKSNITLDDSATVQDSLLQNRRASPQERCSVRRF